MDLSGPEEETIKAFHKGSCTLLHYVSKLYRDVGLRPQKCMDQCCTEFSFSVIFCMNLSRYAILKSPVIWRLPLVTMWASPYDRRQANYKERVTHAHQGAAESTTAGVVLQQCYFVFFLSHQKTFYGKPCHGPNLTQCFIYA